MALTVQKKEYPWKSRHTGGLVSSNPHFWLLGAIFTPLPKTYDTGKTSVARHCSRPTVIGISEPELHGFVLTGRNCTFSGSWYPRGIAILDMWILNFSTGIVMNRKLNKFSSQTKKMWDIWMNGWIIVKQNVRISIFQLVTLFRNGVVYLKLVYYKQYPQRSFSFIFATFAIKRHCKASWKRLLETSADEKHHAQNTMFFLFGHRDQLSVIGWVMKA